MHLLPDRGGYSPPGGAEMTPGTRKETGKSRRRQRVGLSQAIQSPVRNSRPCGLDRHPDRILVCLLNPLNSWSLAGAPTTYHIREKQTFAEGGNMSGNDSDSRGADSTSDDRESDVKRTPATLWRAMGRILVFSYPYRYRLLAGLILTLLATGVCLVIPLGVRSLLDAVFHEGDRGLLDKTVAEHRSVARSLRDFYRDRLLTTTMAIHPLFAPFTLKQRRKLMAMFKSKTFNDTEVIVGEGGKGQGLYLLLTGQVLVTRQGRKLACLGPGAMFGEMSLLSDDPTAASVSADGDALVLRLPKRGFLAVAKTEPRVPQMLKELAAERTKTNEVQIALPATAGDDVLI